MTHPEPRARITSKVRTIDGRRRQEIEAEREGAKGAKGKGFERAEGKTPVEAKPDATAEARKNYSRGEGQKTVTQAYKDNWNAIYGKKKKR